MMPSPPTSNRVLEALAVAAVSAGIAVYASQEVLQRDVEHLRTATTDLREEMHAVAEERRVLALIEHRLESVETELRAIDARLRTAVRSYHTIDPYE